MALFFFPGVGVVDDQVGQGELAGGLGSGDQAVDGLGLPGEGIRGCSTPRRGQRDLTILMRVRAIEHRAPTLGRGVIVADQPRVGVEIHALVPHRTRGRCALQRAHSSYTNARGSGTESTVSKAL